VIRWVRQHARVFLRTLARFKAQPVAAALNALVIGVALSLPATGYVLLANLGAAAQGIAARPQLSLFLRLDADAQAVADIQARLESHPSVAAARFVPKEAALEQLAERTGLPELASALDGNPLPDAFVVDTRADLPPSGLERLREELAGWPGVDHVQLDSAWAHRLDALLRLGRTGIAVLGALLGIALVLAATDGFIRRPFLYYGALLGLAGGAIAWGIVEACLRLLEAPVAELARLYGGSFRLASPGWRESLVLLGLSAALGWLGAILSVSRHLRDIEPH
jgi:cell division transport system permease protein